MKGILEDEEYQKILEDSTELKSSLERTENQKDYTTLKYELYALKTEVDNELYKKVEEQKEILVIRSAT